MGTSKQTKREHSFLPHSVELVGARVAMSLLLRENTEDTVLRLLAEATWEKHQKDVAEALLHIEVMTPETRHALYQGAEPPYPPK